jgi:hypothetical protein
MMQKSTSNNYFKDSKSSLVSRIPESVTRENDSFTRRQKQGEDSNIFLLPLRDPVRTPLLEKIKYLKLKMCNWNEDQLVYEFTGPSKSNWELVVGKSLVNFIFMLCYFVLNN